MKQPTWSAWPLAVVGLTVGACTADTSPRFESVAKVSSPERHGDSDGDDRDDGNCGDHQTGGGCKGDVLGFSMARDLSVFDVGNNPSTQVSGDFERLVGSQGTFATFLPTGGTFAVPNADATVTALRPLTMSSVAHNARVRAYFVSRGLPADQISRIAVNTIVDYTEVRGQRGPMSFSGFTSILERAVDLFPIADSAAAATLMRDGAVALERTWWPTIPRQVVADARALRRTLNDPATMASFLARLPTENKQGTVTIRHSRWRDNPFVVFASFDVVDGGSRRHFDIHGVELFLPGEAVATPPSTGSLFPPSTGDLPPPSKR